MKGRQSKSIIGLLGGIGSGKSTVAAAFGQLGAAVISADRIAHEILDLSPVQGQVVDLLGRDILGPDGRVNRAEVARRVFADPTKVHRLDQIVHPPVMAEVERLIEHYQALDNVRAIVLDIPLLVEVGWAGRCDRLVFIECDWATRAKRALARGLDTDQILQREKFQISLDRKKGLADNTVNNNSEFSALTRQVAGILSQVVNT